FTPNMVCVVYVGFDDNSQLGLEGAKSALPIWTDFMKRALVRRPDLAGNEFSAPKTGITKLTLDRRSGLIASEGCSEDTYEEFFISCNETTETGKDGDDHPILLKGEEGFPPIDDSQTRNGDDDPPKKDLTSRPRRAGIFRRMWEKLKDKE